MRESVPTRLLFVCLGNICRSPMAECVFSSLVKEHNELRHSYEIDSAGIAGCHIGELPDARMREAAWQRGYKMTSRARQIHSDDFEVFDLIIGMDDANIDALKDLAPDVESLGKIVKMTDYCIHMEADHVPDPYYGGTAGFYHVIDLLEDACKGLLDNLEKQDKR